MIFALLSSEKIPAVTAIMIAYFACLGGNSFGVFIGYKTWGER
jgi:hypothetical protein